MTYCADALDAILAGLLDQTPPLRRDHRTVLDHPPEAGAASRAMFAALDTLVNAGGRPPCWQRPHGPRKSPWLSEDPDERAHAATLCDPCPLLEPCFDLADAHAVQFGVFAGLDWTTDPNDDQDADQDADQGTRHQTTPADRSTRP